VGLDLVEILTIFLTGSVNGLYSLHHPNSEVGMNPMEALRYVPKEGDIIMSTGDNGHGKVISVGKTHAKIEWGTGFEQSMPFAHLRTGIIKGSVFVVRKEEDNADR